MTELDVIAPDNDNVAPVRATAWKYRELAFVAVRDKVETLADCIIVGEVTEFAVNAPEELK